MFTQKDRIQKDIEELSKFNETPHCGVTRLSFTKEDRGAREYIKNEMAKAGLDVYEDAAGTIVGRLVGKENNRPVVMIGSHYDSVRNGGCFDGSAGVVTALEVARTLQENKLMLKYPVELVAMIEEEGSRFGGGLFASRAMAGQISKEELSKLKDKNGISLAEAMKSFGFDPDKIQEAVRKPENIKAFLELHIEQGPILEEEEIEIGIVESVVGMTEIEVTIIGRPDHAGTTPMHMRADALDAAAQVISKISSLAVNAGEGTVATVGIFNLLPGSANIVPGKVTFTVDVRSKKKECIEEVIKSIEVLLKEISIDKGVRYSIIEKLNVAPVALSEKIRTDMEKLCEALGFTKRGMLSGAGHDAMIMASITEVGLLFVPSKGGRSHCPEEWTDYEALQKGIEVMYHEVVKLAEVVE